MKHVYRATGGEFCELNVPVGNYRWCNDQADDQPAAKKMVDALREMIANLR